MTRHAYPTMPDDRTRDQSRPADPSDVGEWDEASERDLAGDKPGLAEADHQILVDDDLDDDDDVEDLDDEDVDDPEEDDEDEDGADDDEDDLDDEDDEEGRGR